MALALLLSLTLLVSCSYNESEPGFFQSQAPNDEPAPPAFPTPSEAPHPTNPALPVAGEAVWTSSEGLRLTSRFAVHAVRRIAGATVLDWSITPLSAPGLEPGQRIPSWVDFGLGRASGSDVDTLLIDPAAGRAYRPLQHESRRRFNHCLCTPLWVAQLDLRLGDTRLLQIAFPALPESITSVDVNLPTLPVFPGVPVTPEGRVPTAPAATDLLRAGEEAAPLAPPYHVSEPADRGPRRVQSIQIDDIEATANFTSVRWTLRSITDQPGFRVFPPAPPVTGPAPSRLPPLHDATASGPQLRVGGRTLSAIHLTYARFGRPYVDCLCTGFGQWARSLREAGGRASVTTVYPPVAAGTTVADIVLPTATTIWRLPVRRVPDGGSRVGPPRAVSVDRWQYLQDRPPAGWSTRDWPTPLPRESQLADYDALVERLLPSSSR